MKRALSIVLMSTDNDVIGFGFGFGCLVLHCFDHDLDDPGCCHFRSLLPVNEVIHLIYIVWSQAWPLMRGYASVGWISIRSQL
jgi:hypothetical protein